MLHFFHMKGTILVVLGLLGLAAAFILGWQAFVTQSSQNLRSSDPQAVKLVAVGDSLTVGQGVPSREAWPVQLTNALQNQGVMISLEGMIARSGWTTSDLLAGQLSRLESWQPDVVIILIGANDLLQGLSPQRYRDNLELVLNQVSTAAPQAQIVLLTIPDLFATPAAQAAQGRLGQALPASLREYNSIIHSLAAERRLTVIELYELSQEMGRDPRLVGEDQFHPSGAEYQRWTAAMAPVLQSLVTRP